jgi:hypothetical protein
LCYKKKQAKLTQFGIILDSKPFAMSVLSIKLIIYIFFIQTMGLFNKPSTKSPTSIASILLTHTTKDTPTPDLNAKDEDRETILHLEKSLKSMSQMIKTKKKDTRHIIRDIPYLFVCLEDSVLFITKSYVDCKVTVLHNRTIDVHLTLDREIEIDQSFFNNQPFESMIHHVHSNLLQITWEKSFLITFFTSSSILQLLTMIRKFILIT